MTVLISNETNPAINLALEAYLHAEREEDYLLFYINSPSVIIGRNQRVEAEADLDFCRDEGIAVIRRISGGGAVYHDEGNVNYSFISSGVTFPADQRKELKKINAILTRSGINAMAGKRGELLLKGFKISGTASFCRGGRCIFHGTLLYDSDLISLERSLKGDPALRGKKIASVPSEVANISSYTPMKAGTREFMRIMAEAAADVMNSPLKEVLLSGNHWDYIIGRYSPDVILQ